MAICHFSQEFDSVELRQTIDRSSHRPFISTSKPHNGVSAREKAPDIASWVQMITLSRLHSVAARERMGHPMHFSKNGLRVAGLESKVTTKTCQPFAPWIRLQRFHLRNKWETVLRHLSLSAGPATTRSGWRQ
jgi:hypothetical protein